MKALFGIDLGTTNSCIAEYTNSGPQIVQIDGAPTVPSVVAHDGQQIIVGREARNMLKVNPEQAVASIKRKIGDSDFRYSLGGRSYSAIDISAEILKYLKISAERTTGKPVEDVVITVPAWYGDQQRRATLAAGEAANLRVLRIINEPTAASLSYQFQNENTEKWLVYDLGGGTFDVSIVSVSKDLKEVLATEGNTWLGGDDFDQLLVKHLSEHLRITYSINPDDSALALAQLRFFAEEIKKQLSTEASVEVNEIVSIGSENYDLSLTVNRIVFERLITPMINSTVSKVDECLRSAHINATDIDRIVLVGGSTRIPLIQELLAGRFEREIFSFIDPDLSVALGACIQSAICEGEDITNAVVDVAPQTLGVAAVGRYDIDELNYEFELGADQSTFPRTFVPLVKKNSRLPARFSRTFSKGVLEQEYIEVYVLQGESSISQENTLVGLFDAPVDDIEGMEIVITFEYDANSIVHVEISDGTMKNSVRRFKMDLNSSCDENTSLKFTEIDSDESLEVELPRGAETGSSNVIVKKVEREIAARNCGSEDAIHKLLQSYKHHLEIGNDDEIDEIEDQLFDWIENS